jgi:tetratricopeptide (TPR) repeat protein
LAVSLAVSLSAPGLFAQNETAAKIQAQTMAGIVNVVVYDKDQKEIGKGTAVVLTDKIAVTSYHLVSGAAKVAGFNQKKKGVDVPGIIAVDKNLDLALIQIDGKVTPLAVGSGEAIAAGKPIYGLGVNESGDVIISEGTIRNLFEATPATKVADTSLAVPETFNGAAVLDPEGKLAGIFIVMDSRLRFVVPVSAVNAMNKTVKATPWKAWTPEDYKTTLEGAWLAGRLSAWQDDTLGAQRNLERVTKAQPDNLEAWSMLAAVYDKQRDYTNAATAFRKVTELDPNRASAQFGLGQTLTRLQRAQEGAAALEKAIALDPGRTEALNVLGEAYQMARDFAKAAAAYEKYLATNPANAWMAYKQLGDCRLETNEFEKAAAAYAEALKSQPNDNNILYRMAQAYERANRFPEAEAAYNKLAEVSPKDAANYFRMIMRMYDISGNTTKAVEAARKVSSLEPKNEEYLYYLAVFLQRDKKDADAVEVFKQILALNPANEQSWFGLGVSHWNLKNYKEGAAAFKKDVELKPDGGNGWLYLGICYMQVKDWNSAVDPLEKAVDLLPGNGNALFNLGVTYLNLKKRPDALEVVKKLKGIDGALAAKLQGYIK